MVLVLELEHHANLLPWERAGEVVVLPVESSVAGTLRALEAAIARARPVLVAVSGASNVTGE